MGRRLGLIIGINDYQDATFQPLQFAETDARALAQWLVNVQGGKWAAADVQLVLGTLATHELMEALITQFCVNVAGHGDLVMIYFAGHAFLDESNGEGYLALANTSYQQPATGLHLLSLARTAMGNSRAAHVVFVLDCFQTGQIWSTRRTSPYDSKPLLGPTLLNTLQQVSNRMILSSCRGNEFAPEVGEKRLGSLAYRTIVGLSGPAVDHSTGQITLSRLHSFLFQTLDEQHRPQMFGQERNPLVLVGEMPVPTSKVSPSTAQTISSSPSSNLSTSAAPSGPLMTQAPQSSTTTAQLAPQPFSQQPMNQQNGSTHTGQLSPITSGQLSLNATEQQCAIQLNRAQQLIQMQNPAEAFNIIEQILQIAPTYVPALILKGQLFGTAGHFEEAIVAIDSALQIDDNNALAWSMRAVLLTNTGQFQEATSAVERSLQLDPNNVETQAIKTSIQENLEARQGLWNNRQGEVSAQKPGGSASFFRSAGLSVLGLLLGGVGAALPLLQLNWFVGKNGAVLPLWPPTPPVLIATLLQGLGLALLCIIATRGSYLYGFGRLLFTLVPSLIATAAFGGVLAYQYLRLSTSGQHFRDIIANPSLLLLFLLLGLWLALAAVLPLVLAIGGFITGLIVRLVRRRRQSA